MEVYRVVYTLPQILCLWGQISGQLYVGIKSGILGFRRIESFPKDEALQLLNVKWFCDLCEWGSLDTYMLIFTYIVS